jgi:protein-L-isoaspartate O-methyltransferase
MPQSLVKQQFQANKDGWTRSLIEGFCQDENGNSLPWMTYPFIDFIKTQLNKEQTLFEYGSGSSTLFFAKRVKQVVSLESDPDWFAFMKQKIAKLEIKNIDLIYLEGALGSADYENFAVTKSQEINQKFDIILIDSLKRSACAKNCLKALNEGGMVILDDSERKHYQKIFDFFAEKKMTRTDFLGISPAQIRVKNTSIFSFVNLNTPCSD